ncbi:MAG: hypothetical protein K0S58_2625, partial [Nitrospira sp.]|nr:hypothetical protein [Nitrospira sp.]
RLEAAETQATMGTPATRAFWMISKDPRPLMNISILSVGKPYRFLGPPSLETIGGRFLVLHG